MSYCTTLTPEEIAALQQQLTELIAAKHKLLTGTQTVSVSYGDKRIEYRAADANALTAIDLRIMEIRAQLGLTRRRAIAVRF